MKNIERIDAMARGERLPRAEMADLIRTHTPEVRAYAASLARGICEANFGRAVYTRGLIEISNVCKNDCLYCGIRRSNRNVRRYRLNRDEILSCCAAGYRMGFRTFVLQRGEDGYFSDERLTEIVRAMRLGWPDCAITLSLGERSRESYQALFDAGANRYLLRHETADPAHYGRLHPPEMSFDNRMRCLYDLREIGYQVGCGSMIGSPFQTAENLADDLIFMQDFHPHMIGTGPFLPHRDTPFRNMPAGSAEETLFVLSLIRIAHPQVLLPATTALGTAEEGGREMGVLAGANVVMPNLSPMAVRGDYMLYDGKLGTRDPAEESLRALALSMEKIGYRLACARGDYPGMEEKRHA